MRNRTPRQRPRVPILTTVYALTLALDWRREAAGL